MPFVGPMLPTGNSAPSGSGMPIALISYTRRAAVALTLIGSLSASPGVAQEDVDPIVVIGRTKADAIAELGQTITLPARGGQTVARFNGPICVKVSGVPAGMANVVRERIEDNIRHVQGARLAPQGCKPNAFVGVLNKVTDTVRDLQKDQPWLFEGMLDYQVDRIFRGSEQARAWHVNEKRNLDGTAVTGPGGAEAQFDRGSVAVNKVEKASRIPQQRMDMAGGVVLIETGGLRGKTFRQLADYATMRLLASTSDQIEPAQASLPTILTLFGEGTAPDGLSDFDTAYLDALYDLPPNSRDSQVIAAIARVYARQTKAAPGDDVARP
jgi:hypothetical protein